MMKNKHKDPKFQIVSVQTVEERVHAAEHCDSKRLSVLQ